MNTNNMIKERNDFCEDEIERFVEYDESLSNKEDMAYEEYIQEIIDNDN